MSLIDENPPGTSEPNPETTGREPAAEPAPTTEMVSQQLTGDPISLAAGHAPALTVPPQSFPEDLRISWSWVHLLVFVAFFFATQAAIATFVVAYYTGYRHLPSRQIKKVLESDPGVLVGSSVLSFALIFFFLYVTLALLREAPFWSTLGWKKLDHDPAGGKGKPWMYFLSGCGLSIFVAIAGSRVENADHTPIEQFFKTRNGAMLLMSMAVLVAPLAEETIFRGYLYPVLARIVSAITKFFGMEFAASVRTGIACSILVTGFLFGLLHGPQLGGNFALVGLLTLVGVIFTLARAWTGTVLASFMLHLGYNSMLAISEFIATKGFTQFPSGH